MHDWWCTRPHKNTLLKTESGSQLRILSHGTINTDSGPDFFDARVTIDGQFWSGNIEMHLRSSDWTKHGHSQDKAYDNVILHVVLENDEDIKDVHGRSIPVLVLTEELLTGKMQSQDEHEMMPVLSPDALEIFGTVRLSNKCKALAAELNTLNGDFETLFQRHLFRRFGMRTNSEPFQQLAHILPHTILRRQRSSIPDLEALLFGQSALLPDVPPDGYSADLLFRYQLLSKKYKLKPMNSQAWKFMRMRPTGFPTIRISQLAALLHQHDHLYSRMITESSPEELFALLDVAASEYWNEHFRFGITSPYQIKKLGDTAAASILINAVASIRFFTGVTRDDRQLQISAIELLRALPPEENSTIRSSSLIARNALESQGILELQNMQSNVDTPFFGTKTPNENHKKDKGEHDEFCSEPIFPYFSRINYDRQQTHRQSSIMV